MWENLSHDIQPAERDGERPEHCWPGENVQRWDKHPRAQHIPNGRTPPCKPVTEPRVCTPQCPTPHPTPQVMPSGPLGQSLSSSAYSPSLPFLCTESSQRPRSTCPGHRLTARNTHLHRTGGSLRTPGLPRPAFGDAPNASLVDPNDACLHPQQSR